MKILAYSDYTLIQRCDTPEGEIINAHVIVLRDVFKAEEADIVAAYDREELERLREARSQLLAETDWWANSDVEMTDERRAYRQTLRDITDNYSSLDDVVWPEKPEA